MLSPSNVILTKLSPPRLTRRILPRARVTQKLVAAVDHRLTIVQAGAGYGKTTALAGLAEYGIPLAWYHLSSEDSDPTTFFLHLLHTCRNLTFSIGSLIPVFESLSTNTVELSWNGLIDELINQLAAGIKKPVHLVFDDFHQVEGSPQVISLMDRLISNAPSDLHFILSTRYPVRLPSLNNWKVHGEVLSINQDDLAFNSQEITDLFHEKYSLALNPEEISSLAQQTEGWAIALQLFWQGIKSGAFSTHQRKYDSRHFSAENLFVFLAQEVLLKLSPDIQDFLRTTAVLRDLNNSICDYLRQEEDSDRYLKYLLENSLFIIDVGSNSLRYHHLFREFILSQLSESELITLHQRAAKWYLGNQMGEFAIYHLFRADLETEAADVISSIGEGLIFSGRITTLNNWITSVSPEVLETHPLLLVFLGDFARLHSRFDEALGWYRQAEERSRIIGDSRSTSQALHGQAKVFLDTVDPVKADLLLQKALQLADGTEDRENRARLLELLAENRLNSGQLEAAEAYRKQARELREIGPGELELSVRVLLRTGKLEQARRILEARLITEQSDPFPTPRAHRETLLLLALILEFQGEWDTAYRYALEGVERGVSLQSPFIVAVGKMRQGHAALLMDTEKGYLEALDSYQETIRIADQLSVPRLKVEAYWGLTRAYGFKGELELAEKACQAGIQAGAQAGDEWISGLILISIGASLALAGKSSEALRWIELARDKFYKVSDTYGASVARLWQCLVWWNSGQLMHLEKNLDDFLGTLHELDYDFLLTRRTLLGPPQPRVMIPLMLYARNHGIQRAYIETILYSLGLSSVEVHPGYQLRMQTLGQFRVWRGNQEIAPGEWKREKARQLIQLLVTYRHVALDRDQIIEFLWPDCDPKTGYRNLKVSLSTLLRVLVPAHTRDAESVYVLREGSNYILRPNADIWIDAAEFEAMVNLGDNQPENQSTLRIQQYQQALTLYQGEFLHENKYEDWCREERDRLLSIYLRTSDQLAVLLLEKEDWRGVVSVCEEILVHDKCWEGAYRMIMQAYHKMGNQTSALRTYQKCLQTLKQELELQPSEETRSLFTSFFPQHPL